MTLNQLKIVTALLAFLAAAFFGLRKFHIVTSEQAINLVDYFGFLVGEVGTVFGVSMLSAPRYDARNGSGKFKLPDR